MKLIADFMSVQDDLSEKRNATVIFDADKNTVYTPKGDEWMLRNLVEDGAFSQADQTRYYPKDGEKFVRALTDRAGSRSYVALREEK